MTIHICDDRISLTERYAATRALSEKLAEPLSPEDMGVQSVPDASPVKWHLAHTTWFFETVVLKAALPNYKPFDPRYAYLFNSYYEGFGPRHPRPQRGLLTRPSTDEIFAYRRHVDEQIADLCTRLGNDHPLTALIVLGLNHEQQHQELILTDIKHAFFSNPLLPAYLPLPAREALPAAPLEWLEHSSGTSRIGHGTTDFAFDNECPEHEVLLYPFRIASRAVTNGEYLAFMEDGGYMRPEFWLSDGWAEKERQGWQAPLYWLEGNGWQNFTLHGVQPLNTEEPVTHVSFYEAAAFAAWSGKRLPTEFEWETIARAQALRYGDVWEWTRSSYDPYPGYTPFEGALGEYNGKFMSGQMVLRGGSRATPQGHIRPTYRNFFPPSTRWQFSGIRLAEDAR